MIGYMLITLGIGFYLTRTNKSVQDFFVAKRSLGVGTIIPLMFAEMIAGAATVGAAAEAYKIGLSAGWVSWGMVLGLIVNLVFVAQFYLVMGKVHGAMSVPEAYGLFFDKKTRLVLMAIMALVFAILFAMQPAAAAGILAPMFGATKETMAWIIAIIFIIITITGGLKGLAWMNVMHSFVMYMGLGSAAYFSIKYIGGYSALQAQVPPDFFTYMQPDAGLVIATALGIAISYIASPTCAQVVFGAKSFDAAKKGLILAGILVVIFAFIPCFIGMAGKVALPGIAANTVIYKMTSTVSPFLGGIAAMAIIAAIFSTGPALLLIVATTVTRDFYNTVIKPGASDADQLKFSRIVIVLTGLIGTYFGLSATSILNQISGAFQIRSVAGLVLIVALFWPRVSANAAFWSMTIGGIIAGVWHFAGNPFGMAPLWPSAAVGIVVLVVLTLMSKEGVSPGYQKYQEARVIGKEQGII